MDIFKGLNRDFKRTKIPANQWELARNILLMKGYTSVANEDGNKFLYLVPGKVIGIIDTNDEVVYYSIDGEYSCIGYVNSSYENPTYISVLRTNNPKIKFNLNCPIEGVSNYNYKKELIVVWCNGINNDSSRLYCLNIHNPQIQLDNNKELINPNQAGILGLFPDVKEADIDFSFSDLGYLVADTIYITYCYVYNDKTDTLYFPLSTVTHPRTSFDELNYRSINLKFTNLDSNFDKLRIGIIIKTKQGIFGYKSQIYNYYNNTFETAITNIKNYIETNAEDLIVSPIFYTKAKTITKQNNKLILGNLETRKEITNLQQYCNRLQLGLELPKSHKKQIGNDFKFVDKYTKKLKTEATLMPDEVYAFYIGLQWLDGSYTQDYHIPGEVLTVNELQVIPDSEFDATIGGSATQLGLPELQGQGFQNFHIYNTGGFVNLPADININVDTFRLKWGKWQNSETYPNTDDYNSSSIGGEDLRNKNIRYHRVPGLDELVKCYEFQPYGFASGEKEVYPLHFEIYVKNFDTVIPDSIKNQIQGFQLKIVKRTRGNTLVETNAIAIKAMETNYSLGIINVPNKSIYFEKPDNNVLGTIFGVDNLLLDYGTLKLYGNDLYKVKPSLDKNLLIKANYATDIGRGIINKQEISEGYILKYNTIIPTDPYMRFAVLKSYEYLPANNIEAKTRFIEDSLYVQCNNKRCYYNGQPSVQPAWRPLLFNGTNETFTLFNYNPVTNTYTSTIKNNENNVNFNIIGVPKTAYSYIINCTILNIQKDLYKGFKSTNLITLGRVSLNDTTKRLSNGDVFTSNKIDVNLNSIVVSSQSNDAKHWDYYLYIQGLYQSLNNSVLKSPKISVTTKNPLGERYLALQNTDAVNVLNGRQYEYYIEGDDNCNEILDLIGGITFDTNNNFINYFPYRVAKSQSFQSENLQTKNIRNFLSNEYYDMPNDRGEIVAVRGINRDLFIQQEYSLYVTSIKDTLQTGENLTYLGQSDIFDRLPFEIKYNNNKGYVGCSSQFACFIFKDGLVVIDQIQGKVFIVSNQGAMEISKAGMTNYFKENLDTGLKYFKYNRNNKKIRIDNPFNSIGFIAGYDDEYERLLITKLYYIPKKSTEHLIFDGEFYYDNNNKRIEFTDNNYFENNSFTFSYSLSDNSWVCEHDYFPNLYYYTNKGLFTILNTINNSLIYKQNDKTVTPSNFFGKQYESYIDVIFNQRLDLLKIYQAIYWNSEVLDREQNHYLFETIDKIVVYTDYQNSGVIELKLFELDRNREGLWMFNEFRDNKVNKSFPIGKNGNINENNINNLRSWFDKSNFISTFIVIRFIFSNLENKVKFIHNINVKSRIHQI